jgi:hypothetical protein
MNPAAAAGKIVARHYYADAKAEGADGRRACQLVEKSREGANVRN